MIVGFWYHYVLLLIRPCIWLWHGHKGPEGRGTDQIWRKSWGRKELEQELWSFWKLLEDSRGFWAPEKSEGRMQKGASLPVAWFRGFPARVTFKLVEWPWTMTFLLTPPSCSISTFNWAKQTQALSPESLTLSQVSPLPICPTASALFPTHRASFLLRWLLQPPNLAIASSHTSVILSALEQS